MKILITLGGTGGHVRPAQDLAQILTSRGHQVSFAGKRGSFFFLKDFQVIPIDAGNIRIKRPLAFLNSCFSMVKGVLQSFIALKKGSFDVIVGMGSFHSVPILLAGKICRKKIVLFEPNIVCGFANRVFSRSACVIATQFPILENHYAKKIYQTKCLPWTRPNLTQKKKEHLTFIVFGGSQGAQFLNQIIPPVIKKLKEFIPYFELIHITGEGNCVETIQGQYDRLNISYTVKKYEENLLSVLSRCDFAICRSGAGTIGDLMTSTTPAILIPYPYATDQHQEKNGAYFAKVIEGGIQQSQSELSEEKLLQIIRKIVGNDRENLKRYRENLARFYKENQSRASIAELIEDLA